MANVIVELAAGKVQGSAGDGVVLFQHIPYATPPVGARRFAVPQPPEPWESVRTNPADSPNAPQMHKPFPGLDVVPLVGDGWHKGDDYLALNIWAPEGATQDLPVMVFIHGGGFLIGSKDPAIQDGTAFARSGVILVSINYRLGVEGFLPIPGIPTNLGLRDQLFALQWVQDNIARFGGDPANVTVFGESAGAMSVANLMVSPLARGLFRRAIIESGHGAMTRPIPIADKLVKKIARIMKIPATKAGFASLPPQAYFKAIEKLAKPWAIDLRDEHGREPVFGISRFVPVHGDDVLPEAPPALLAKGAGADVDLLIGTNREEMNLYFGPTGVRKKIPGFLARWFVGRSQPNARAVLRDYGMGQKGVSAGDAMTFATNDLVFRWPARRFAEQHQGRTWFYEFEWQTPACGGTLGACHAIEVPFVFNTLACTTGPEGLVGENPPQALADRVHSLWVDFARSGTLPWAQFDADTRMVHELASGETVHEPVMPAARHLP